MLPHIKRASQKPMNMNMVFLHNSSPKNLVFCPMDNSKIKIKQIKPLKRN